MPVQTPKGMTDILPEEWEFYEYVLEKVKEIAEFYGFQRIETPILEETELFSRGVGEGTDIVEKEMFSFRTKGGDHLTLRPEGTAPVVRAYFQNGLASRIQPVKLWYFGPFFRHERPQAGRKRQFWQFGLEILGESNFLVDVEIIFLLFTILKELQIKNPHVEINTLGDNACRPYYKKALSSYLRSKMVGLCSQCKERLKINPLRVLDCKDERCRQIISSAPQILDYLCEECKNHFKKVLEFLEHIGIPFALNPYLVRGLDYYTRTVFEINFPKEEIGSLIGGGRYDILGKLIQGKELPGVGGAGGIERIIEVLKAEKIELRKERVPKFFFAQIGELAKKESFKILEELRKNKIEVLTVIGKESLKAQMRTADKYQTKYVLILGQKEAMAEEIIIRDMASAKQKVVKLKNLIKELKKLK